MKRISEYGTVVLDELEGDRADFRRGKIDADTARTVATLCNSTSRAMGETLRARKFETSIAALNA